MMVRAMVLALAWTLPVSAGDLGGSRPGGIALPLDLGGPFRLVDQNGQVRTETDPERHIQLLFFGYANCEAICSVALPLMAEAGDILAAAGVPTTPIMITVDPERDSPAAMREALARISPRIVGLTGDAAALDAAYRAFQVDREVVFTDPAGAPVYAHGSFVYVLDGEGRFLTLVPPVVSPKKMAEVVAAQARAL